MRKVFFLCLLASLLISGCTNDHFITDRNYRNKVEVQFEKQKELAKNRSQQLFGVFGQALTTRETEALKFLYAYSSLNDLADYTGEFFLQNVRSSFAARDTFSWGKTVPENLFRHFVLPVRVNNENLDSSRWVFFAELKDRIRKLPMKDAVLEVNHWCHEKVTYRGSDGRTSAPLASVKTALGRCGEESTFTVAALRSVGIPARQCYTPRWAHSDDNHAWVEVWVDGKWHFIGACEPDADLDLAWFTKPAKRAMLVNTTVFGDYEGPEDVLQKDPLFTKINVLENYAPVKKVFARVTDAANRNLDSADVEFQLYNYAEFYPLFKTFTSKDGLCSFKTGYGDLLVWAAKNGKYGFQKLDVRTTDTVNIRLDREAGQTYDLEFDMVPPAELELTVVVSDLARKKNSDRLAFEDGFRGSYEATFIDSVKSSRFARLVNLDQDTLWRFFHKSRGNWRELTAFITLAPPEKRPLIFPLFDNISEKDLRDIDTTVLLDNISNSTRYPSLVADRGDFNRYVLSPRVDNEFLKPYKQFFQSKFEAGFITGSRNNPMQLADWVRTNISINNTANYSRAPITPVGVYELKTGDGHSIDICFVAICRSFGIPARLEPATKVPQYLLQGQWHDVYLFEKKQHAGTKAPVVLVNPPANEKKPEYTIHYTLETFQNGYFKTLDYEGSPLVQTYPCNLDIPVGPCLMVTGNRLTNGTVLTKLRVFEVKSGVPVTQTIDLRKNQLPLLEYGRISPALFSHKLAPGMVLAWIDPDKEPSKHFVADLRQKQGEFGQWKGTFVMIFPSEAQMKSFVKAEAAALPKTISYTFQSAFTVKLPDIKLSRGTPKNMPVVMYLNSAGVINYLSEGYRIGIGDELLSLMK
ncbi:MAG: transglutaminase-like domain-containing protein [Bacteroidetes bacterium]|nr:transglutaminase-like domain-containing protein [Bacteroidota bacterium]